MSINLSVQNVDVNFGGVKALKGVSFSLTEDLIWGLIGPNGSGKSTLVNVLTSFQEPSSGKVILNQEDISSYNKIDLANKGVTRTFQSPRVFKTKTLIENMLIALYAPLKQNGTVSFRDFTISLHEKLKNKVSFCTKVLEVFFLKRQLNDEVQTLSYGQLRTLELCMCLVRNPKIIYLDEPTSGLNEEETEKLAEQIKGIKHELMIPFFLVDHKFSFLEKICDKILVLDEGKLIYGGTAKAVRSNAQVKRIYFGEKVQCLK